MTKAPNIKIEKLAKSFGRELILDQLDLNIEAGLINFIIGQSGAGKSVLLKHLIGLMTPDQGQIYFDGRPMIGQDSKAWKNWRPKMGILFQDGALFDFMTVGQNVCFPLTVHRKMSYSRMEELARAQMKKLDIEAAFKHKVSALSTGERKRAALARALILEPDILFFDEPTTGLDPILSAQVDELILTTRKNTGATLVVVSHDIPATLALADKVAMVYQGRIWLDGPPDVFKTSADPVIHQFLTAQEDGPIAKLSEV